MSGDIDMLSLKEEDVTKMLAAYTYLGTDNVNFQMEQYVYKRRPDGNVSFFQYSYLDNILIFCSLLFL